MQWLSTRDVACLIQEYYPANEVKVREWCESGHIPPEFVKRSISPKGRGRWWIASRGLDTILQNLLLLSPQERHAIHAKLLTDAS